MPIVEVEGQQFEFPEGTTDEVIGNAIRGHFATQPEPVSQQEDTTGLQERLNQAILDAPGGSVLAELGSAVSRGAVNLADFFVAKPLQAIQQLAGVEEPTPTIAETELGQAAITGQFMEPGLARDIVRTGGELIAPGAAVGQALRTTAKAIPQVQAAAQTLGQRVTQQLGTGAARADVAGAGLAGAGLEVGGEVGEAVGGETGREVGEFIGSIAFPISGAIAAQTGKKLVTTSAKKLLKESAPTIDGLKTAARQVYKEIDDLGAVVDSSRVTRLGRELQAIAQKEGFDADIHPKVNAALNRVLAVAEKDLTVTELDTLRKIARNAASSIDPSEKRLGTLIVNKIDDTLDQLKPSDFKKGGGEIGAKFRDARQLWQRAKKSELIEDAFSKARLQATGFENGIRTQFRQILNNKKKLAGFSNEEKEAMRQVVKGTSLQNLAKMIGRFGFSEGQASNMLLGSLGVAGGATAFGTTGAVAVPLIGQVSRNLAQKLTRKGAELTNTIIRAGKNAEKVAQAYIKAVPAKERSSQELSELLLRPDVSLGKLESKLAALPAKHKKLISDAVFFAKATKDQEEEQ